MNYIEHKITLDIHKTVSQASLSVKKGDTGRRLLIRLSVNGLPYHISGGCYAVLTAKKPDGKVLFNSCSIDDSVIIYNFTVQTVAVVGMMDCEIILFGSNGAQLTSACFTIIVENTVYDTDEVESTNEYNSLTELLAKVQAVQATGPVAPAIVCVAEGEQIHLSDSSDYSLRGLRIFGKSTQNGTPTVNAPVDIVNVGVDGSIETKIVGKNIVSDFAYLSSNTDYASLVKCNDTGAVKKGETYTISVTLTADNDTKAYWNDVSGFFVHELITVSAGTKRYIKTFTALADGDIGTTKILLSKSSTGDGVVIQASDCQIECGAVATDYELSSAQSVVISTLNGLAGIPVASGGNYTDNNGQQWICDEIDMARAVYIQRIATINLSTINNWARGTGNGWANVTAFHSSSAVPKAVLVDGYDTKANILCNRLVIETAGKVAGRVLNSVGQGMGASIYASVEGIETVADLIAYFKENETIVQYALAKPIEMALTDAEISAFSALHTCKLNTSIYNDEGAYMAAEYVADTRTYIDTKNDSLAATISEVTLLASAWVGSDKLYSQVVEIDGVTENSKVDLEPSIEQLAIFHDKDLAFVTENEDGVVTVFALGDKPTNDYTMQVTITEVKA